VERSWTAGIDDPDFWNPKLRGPSALIRGRTILPSTYHQDKTELVLAGQSKAQMFDSIKAAFDKKELPTQEPGATVLYDSQARVLFGPIATDTGIPT